MLRSILEAVFNFIFRLLTDGGNSATVSDTGITELPPTPVDEVLKRYEGAM